MEDGLLLDLIDTSDIDVDAAEVKEDSTADIIFDLLEVPHEICNCDKRRKCDSLYIERYNKLALNVFKAKTILNEIKDKLSPEDLKKINAVLDLLTEKEVE